MDNCELTEERKAQIDALSHYAMCSMWRYASTGDWMITGDCGDYFKKRLFSKLGGFTPAISKSLSSLEGRK